MNVIFNFNVGNGKYFELVIDWMHPFLPEIGDTVSLIDYFNEADILLAKSIIVNHSDEYDNLFDVLLAGDYLFQVSRKKWVYGGVKIGLWDENEVNENLYLSFPTAKKSEFAQLSYLETFHFNPLLPFLD